jgi:hypothetical protein
MESEIKLLRLAFFRCLQDTNYCTYRCKPEDECDCAADMQAYLDEARHELVGKPRDQA